MGDDALLALLIFVASTVYASVGQAGGSGYLAVMALVGVAPEVMRPEAPILNILVAGIASVRFSRAGHLRWSALWPFLAGSLPLAFVGGALYLPGAIYNAVVGLILVVTAVPLIRSRKGEERRSAARRVAAPAPLVMALGAVIGLLAGLTGTGGGIFLGPLLLYMGGADRFRDGTAAVAPS